jgi:hypothetical protein
MMMISSRWFLRGDFDVTHEFDEVVRENSPDHIVGTARFTDGTRSCPTMAA